jgi:hypothetical protein
MSRSGVCRANTSWQTGRVYQYGGLKVTELKHGTTNNCFYTGIMNRPDGYERQNCALRQSHS